MAKNSTHTLRHRFIKSPMRPDCTRGERHSSPSFRFLFLPPGRWTKSRNALPDFVHRPGGRNRNRKEGLECRSPLVQSGRMGLLMNRCRSVWVLFFAIAPARPLPPVQRQLEEEKEPQFVEGKRRLNALDYPGAIECFEKAIAVNPRSAGAHFEAGILYEKNQQDYAAAVYHFERFLDLRPRSEYADVVKQRIVACKQELARTISLGPVTQTCRCSSLLEIESASGPLWRLVQVQRTRPGEFERMRGKLVNW